ncbi:MAG: hypothetical protein Tsb0021_17370 [Chlamydiales bacterium]
MGKRALRVLWIHESLEPLEHLTNQVYASVSALSKENIVSILLYNPLKNYDPTFLQVFQEAYPIINLEKQIVEIDPDRLCICTLKKEKFDSIPKKFKGFIFKYDTANIFKILRQEYSAKRERILEQDIPQFDVVLRTCNDEDIIAMTLKGLLGQHLQPRQIHIVDSGSQDNTLDIIHSFGLTVHQILPEEYFPGKILNESARQLNEEIIIFLNSDAIPLSPLTFTYLLRPFKNETVQATFARQVPRPDAEPWVVRDYRAAFPETSPAPQWMPFSLPCAAIRRTAWEKHPFYTLAWGSEDTEWGVWAKENEYKIMYIPEACVMHSHNYSLKEIYGRRFIEGEADAFIYSSPYTPFHVLKDTCKASIRDFFASLQQHTYLSLFKIPLRRFIYYWGYYSGHTFGLSRKKQQVNDPSQGQKIVLSSKQLGKKR